METSKKHFFYYLLHNRNFFLSYIKVGTHTLRHINGSNNFIIRGEPLGWRHGSDGRELEIGLNFFNKKNIIIKAIYGLREFGEESIINRPYEPYQSYLKGDFPSGQSIYSKKYIKTSSEIWYNYNSSLHCDIELSEESNSFNIGLNIFFNNSLKI